MENLDIIEYAHTYEKLERQNVPLWISNLRSNIEKFLSGFSHIKEALAIFITCDQTNNSGAQMDMQTVLENSLMFLVWKRHARRMIYCDRDLEV